MNNDKCNMNRVSAEYIESLPDHDGKTYPSKLIGLFKNSSGCHEKVLEVKIGPFQPLLDSEGEAIKNTAGIPVNANRVLVRMEIPPHIPLADVNSNTGYLFDQAAQLLNDNPNFDPKNYV